MSRWEELARAAEGERYAEAYAARFRALAESGADVHGEASYVATLLPPGARVLDAGCGTGRVTARLAELGYDAVGCDADPAMIEVARRETPGLDLRVADLATLDLGAEDPFDLVLLAGNVVPLLAPRTLRATWARIAVHLAPGGRAVAGFGLDAVHLPRGCPVTPLAEVLEAAAGAGLMHRARYGGWAAEPFEAGDGYVVLVLAAAERSADGSARSGWLRP